MISIVNSYNPEFLALANTGEQDVEVALKVASRLDIETRRFSEDQLVTISKSGDLMPTRDFEIGNSSCYLSIEPRRIFVPARGRAKVAVKMHALAPMGIHEFRVFAETADGNEISTDLKFSKLPDVLQVVDPTSSLRFKFHVQPASKRSEILCSPRGRQSEDVLVKSLTLQNVLDRKIKFEFSTSNPCFSVVSSKTCLLPTEVARVKVTFKPDKTALAQVQHEDILLAGYCRPVTEMEAQLLIDFASKDKRQTIELHADIIRPDVEVVNFTERTDFGYTHVEFPISKSMTLVNKTSATGEWKIEHIPRETAKIGNSVSSSPAAKTIGEIETNKAEDAGFEVFIFDKISGTIRGPSRAPRSWPAPKPTEASHADSADFDPVDVKISFTPKRPGYVQSRFRLSCGDLRRDFILCGCASREEVDARRIVNGILRQLA